MSQGVRLFLAFAGVLASGAAAAHTGVHVDGNFYVGIDHPYLGLDHLLVMAAAVAWTAQIAVRRTLTVPPPLVAAIGLGAWLLLAA